MKYSLGDYTIKNWNSWDRVPRMPEVFVSAVASAIGAGTAATIIGYIAYTAVTSWALNALAPKPDFGGLTSRGILVNAKDATAPADFVYGEVRKGGVVTYYESTGETNKYLHQIIVLAAHEVNNIGDIYINDTVVTLDGSGFVTSDGWNSKIRIQKFDGSQTTAPADLLSESELTGADALDANFVGNGLAYLYVRYEYDQDVFANGIPLITAVVQGKKVYDPRTSTTAYSNNAALCIRDFLTAEYGLNDSAIDDVSFSAAANECDESVALSGGGTESRYTINGIVRADRDIGSTLGDMMAACAGTLFWGSGYWKLKAGAYSAPVKTLTLDDLRGPISLDTRITLRDNFNEVQGTFNDASQDWITVDYPKLTSTAFVNEDGGSGNETALDLQLPYTTSASAAQRLAKLTLFRGREQMTLTAEFGMNAFDIEVGDIIALDNDRYGWTAKEFEVIGWRLAANQDAGDLRVALTLRETSEAAFDWNAEESDIIGNETTLTDPRNGLTVSNLTVTDKGNTQTDGTFVGQALVQWTKATNSFLNHYEVQWKDVNETSYQRTEIPADENSVIIGSLETGTQYDIRVRGVTVSGIEGSWLAATPYTHGGDTVAPSPVTALSATGGPKIATLDWTAPTTQVGGGDLYDLKGYYIYRNTINSKPNDPIAFSGSDKYVDGGLGVDTEYFYWVSAVDFTGNESTAVASGAVTTDAQAAGVDTDTRIYSGRIYYQTLQATAPSAPTPSNFSFNVGTETFGTLQSGWSHSQPVVSNTSLSVKEWSVSYTVVVDADDVVESITFGAVSGAFQITDTIESDNFSSTDGWQINKDGTATFNASVIRGTLQVGQVPTLTSSKISDLGALATQNSVNASTQVSGLATVATSGSYNSLTDQPSLFDGQYSSLSGTPTLFDGNYSSLSGTPSIPNSTSDLTNDSDFQTGSQVSTTVSNATSGLATESYVVSSIGTKNKIHYTSSTPTATATGDLWYNTSTTVFKRWTGSSWVDVSITADSIAANFVYAGNIDAVQINSGTINVDRLPGLTRVFSATSTGATLTVSFSGVPVGSKIIVNGNVRIQSRENGGSQSFSFTSSGATTSNTWNTNSVPTFKAPFGGQTPPFIWIPLTGSAIATSTSGSFTLSMTLNQGNALGRLVMTAVEV